MQDFGEKYFDKPFEHLHSTKLEAPSVYVTLTGTNGVFTVKYFKDAGRTKPLKKAEADKLLKGGE